MAVGEALWLELTPLGRSEGEKENLAVGVRLPCGIDGELLGTTVLITVGTSVGVFVAANELDCKVGTLETSNGALVNTEDTSLASAEGS